MSDEPQQRYTMQHFYKSPCSTVIFCTVLLMPWRRLPELVVKTILKVSPFTANTKQKQLCLSYHQPCMYDNVSNRLFSSSSLMSTEQWKLLTPFSS